ncbi:MAG TPA: hypothetical protein VM076_14140 [Gemmatimonadaceae bacterium]|nr:hypothetical protein [Gemmatimonadaceae bacterium]
MPTQSQIVPESARLSNLACTKCGSAEVRRLSLIYQEGLAIINTSSQTSGAAFGSGGGASFGSASTRTTGTQQTALSKQAAPPAKKHTILWGMAAGILGMIALSGLSDFSFSVVVFAALAALAGRMSLKAKVYNAATFPELYARWERSFMCNRCGETFTGA